MRIVTMARKPLLEGTVAQNTLGHGTGALNIDASRIHSGPSVGGASSGGNAFGQDAGWNKTEVYVQGIDRSMSSGRWPANVILNHLSGCQRLGTMQIKGTPPTPSGFDRYNASLADQGYRPNTYQRGAQEPPPSRLDADGRETVEAWDCEPGCPVADLDEQSGSSKSSGGRIGNKDGGHIYGGGKGLAGGFEAGDPGFGDVGGASRYFKQIKP